MCGGGEGGEGGGDKGEDGGLFGGIDNAIGSIGDAFGEGGIFGPGETPGASPTGGPGEGDGGGNTNTSLSNASHPMAPGSPVDTAVANNPGIYKPAYNTNATRANAWNERVSNFNHGLTGEAFNYELANATPWQTNYTSEQRSMDASANGGLRGRMNTLTGLLGDMSIGDMWDDPSTNANEAFDFEDLVRRAERLQADYGKFGTNFGNNELIQNVTVGGQEQALDYMPTLLDANMDVFNQVGTGIESLMAGIEDLRSQREAEQARYDEFSSGLSNGVASLYDQADMLDMSNLTGINSLRRQANALSREAGGFDSVIADQLGYGSTLGTDLEGVNGILDGLLAQRDQEQSRIDTFEQGLMDSADQYRNLLDGTTIADEAKLKQLQKDIADRMREANRFKSDLGFDFADETGDLSSLGYQVSGLMDQRASELARIENTRNSFADQLASLQNRAGNTRYTNMTGINSLQSELDALMRKRDNFKSDLGFDFSGLGFDAADSTLDGLTGRYNSELDALLAQLNGYDDTADGLALTDFDQRENLGMSLDALSKDLQAFNGNRALDLKDELGDVYDQLGSQDQQVANKRSNISAQIKDLMEGVKASSYYDQEDVSSRLGDLGSLRDEADLYRLLGVDGSLSQIESYLDGQGDRLTTDASTVTAREAADAERARQQLSQMNSARDLMNQSVLSDDDMRRLMQLFGNSNEDPTATQSASAFATALGV